MASRSSSHNQTDPSLQQPQLLTLPDINPYEKLAAILKTSLTHPESPLGQELSATERHHMRRFYLPPIPEASDHRHSQFQHKANACSQLFRALEKQGHSRQDIKIGLEHIRYLSFIEEARKWISSASAPMPSKAPPALAFDIRSRAFAKEAFKTLAHHLRIPHNIADHGTITPIFFPHIGYAFRVTSDGEKRTFLAALLNGHRLEPIPDDPHVLCRSLYSPNRQLLNLLHAQAPVWLEKAYEPRPVTYMGSSRISLFCRNDEASPPNYLYLPPSVKKESYLLPRVDGAKLIRGEKSIELISSSSKRVVATVSLAPDAPTSFNLDLSAHIEPSPFTRFKPLAGYLRGQSAHNPTPLRVQVNRSERSPAFSQQRVLLGNQMCAPAWYPLRELEVHALTAPDNTKYVGLYPSGVSPITNPPMRAFTLHPTEAAWHPASTASAWRSPKQDADQLIHTLEQVCGSSATTSREAWLRLHEFSRQAPLLTYALLFSKNHPFSVWQNPAVREVEELPGWQIFQAGLEKALLPLQARSVPFVARLLALARDESTPFLLSTLGKFTDHSWADVEDPVSHLTRLASTAQPELEASIKRIQNSHNKQFAALAGNLTLNNLLLSLSQRRRSRPV